MNALAIALAVFIAWALASYAVYKIENAHFRANDAHFPYQTDGYIFGALEQFFVPLFCALTVAYNPDVDFSYLLVTCLSRALITFIIIYVLCRAVFSFTHQSEKVASVVDDIGEHLEWFYMLPETVLRAVGKVYRACKGKKTETTQTSSK